MHMTRRKGSNRACTAKTPMPPKRERRGMEERACMSHDHHTVPFYYIVPAGTNPPCPCGRTN